MPTLWKSPLPDIDATPALLHDEILGTARHWPQRIAVTDAGNGRRLTYGALDVAIRWMAGGLRLRGAQRGDVVALVAGTSPDYAIALYAALAAGLVVAPINPMHTPRELVGAMRRVGARYVLADPAALPAAAEAASSCGVEAVLTLSPGEGAASTPSTMAAEPLPPQDGDPHATALLFNTSGTVGCPRAPPTPTPARSPGNASSTQGSCSSRPMTSCPGCCCYRISWARSC
jgi:acyl-CoA synthetase (AMP-forming)/AMP-acid ligase II